MVDAVTLEDKIKTLAQKMRDDLLVGLAGPERLTGPPSIDPSYVLPGAKSVVSMAIPMHVPSIYDFLSKKTAASHNADQLHGNQQVLRIGERVASFLESRGFRAKVVPVNTDYRRSLDVLSFHPSFCHRYGALASGLAGQGWSGNVVTKKYGAAVYLGTVVTDALLKSDPAMDPREMIENRCSKCRICEKSCPVGMFERDEEELVLLGGNLYPRGKRKNLDLCTASCFGMHGLSRDKRWTTWSEHWIDQWIDGVPNPQDKRAVRAAFMKKVFAAGDSGRRQYFIRLNTIETLPKQTLSLIPPAEQTEQYKNQRQELERAYAQELGLKGLSNINVLTCGHCALVCGPTLKERGKRYKMLASGGFIAPGGKGQLVHTDTYGEALRLHRKRSRRVNASGRLRDLAIMLRHYLGNYLGFEPISWARGIAYEAKRKRAMRSRNRQKGDDQLD